MGAITEWDLHDASSCSAPRSRSARPTPLWPALHGELDAGNLRHIRLGGVEAIRAITFIVRDRNWGTYKPGSTSSTSSRGPTASRWPTRGRKDAEQGLRYRARIGGRRRRIALRRRRRGADRLLTNRTGFVVLHPIEGVAGAPVEVAHVDGARRAGGFPELIDPVCPLGLRALTHEAAAGVRSPAGWRATPSRWRTSATGSTPPTRPMCGRSRCPGPTRSGRARRTRSGSTMVPAKPPAAAGRAVGDRLVGRGGRRRPMPRLGLAVAGRPPSCGGGAGGGPGQGLAGFIVGDLDSRAGDGAVVLAGAIGRAREAGWARSR